VDPSSAEQVLLAPVLDEPDAAAPYAQAARGQRLVVADTHVEWHDGDTVTRWTLPDQPPQDGVPVLAAVLDAETRLLAVDDGAPPERYVVLVDAHGQCLVQLGRVSPDDAAGWTSAALDRVWPSSGFDALVAHGVRRGTGRLGQAAAPLPGIPQYDDALAPRPAARADAPRTRSSATVRLAVLWICVGVVAVVGVLFVLH